MSRTRTPHCSNNSHLAPPTPEGLVHQLSWEIQPLDSNSVCTTYQSTSERHQFSHGQHVAKSNGKQGYKECPWSVKRHFIPKHRHTLILQRSRLRMHPPRHPSKTPQIMVMKLFNIDHNHFPMLPFQDHCCYLLYSWCNSKWVYRN